MTQAVARGGREIRKDNPVLRIIGKIALYVVLIFVALFTLIPFVWMISSSLKLDREVFIYPSGGSPKPSTGRISPSSGRRFRC